MDFEPIALIARSHCHMPASLAKCVCVVSGRRVSPVPCLGSFGVPLLEEGLGGSNETPPPGIEPRSSAWPAEILTTILKRTSGDGPQCLSAAKSHVALHRFDRAQTNRPTPCTRPARVRKRTRCLSSLCLRTSPAAAEPSLLISKPPMHASGPRGVTVNTLDSESSERGSSLRGATSCAQRQPSLHASGSACQAARLWAPNM